jgi:RPA family protein
MVTASGRHLKRLFVGGVVTEVDHQVSVTTEAVEDPLAAAAPLCQFVRGTNLD